MTSKAYDLGNRDGAKRVARSPFRHFPFMPTDAAEKAQFIGDYDRGYDAARPQMRAKDIDDLSHPRDPVGNAFGFAY